jgi:hypothetical protein
VTTGLVLGGSASVWDDAAEALHLFRPDVITAVNDIGTRWAGRIDLFCTLHHEKMSGWRAARAARGFLPAALHIGHEAAPGIDQIKDYRWPGMNASGSSGLYAVKLLMDSGVDRIVLAGVPMDPAGAHFFDAARWEEVASFWQAWLDQAPRLQGIVKSMSGRTQTLLGAPTAKWLGAAALQGRTPGRRPNAQADRLD